MIIMNLIYQQPLTVVQQFLDTHNQFLDHYFKKGIFLVSGPKAPRDGGIILANCSHNEAEAIIKSDPFYQHNIAHYTITEFTATKNHLTQGDQQ